MAQSFLVYAFLIFAMFFLGNNSFYKKYRPKKGFFRFNVFLSLIIFSVISGLRYDVGVDYFSYLESYQDLLSYSKIESESRFEYGFSFLQKQFARYDIHYSIMFGFYAFLQIFLIYYAFKKEQYLYPYLSFIIMTGGFYFTMMNEIRQSIACCLLILGVHFAKKTHLLKYLALAFIAVAFHSSGVILIPILLILVFKIDFFKSIWLQLALLASSIFINETDVLFWISDTFAQQIDFFSQNDKYENILDVISIWEKNYVKGVRYYSKLLIFVIIILYSKKLKSAFSNTNFIKFYNLFFIGAILFVLTYNNTLYQRPARYFMFMEIIISAYTLMYLLKNKFSIALLLISLNILIFAAYVLSDHHTYYLFFWQA